MNLEGMVSARVDLGFMDRARIALRSPDLREAWKVIRKPVRADIKEHAKKQEAPGGSWAPRSSATKTRTSGRKRARKLLGRLPGAIGMKGERRRMIVRSLVSWSAAQRDGARVGHGAKIPGRDWLWISDKVLDVASNVISKGIAYLIEGS